MSVVPVTGDPWDVIVGQPEAVRRLRAAAAQPVHAWMFVGPSGSGKRRAALTFGGEILAALDPAAAERHRRLAAQGSHPDIVVFEPSGTALRLGTPEAPGEVRAIAREATRSPVESSRKIVVIDRFETAEDKAASFLLKLVEEPPESTMFVLLATDVPAHQITIESRCTRVDFGPVADDDIVASLVAEGLAEPSRAVDVAAAAGGDLSRARVLAADAAVVARRDAWWSVPDRLDGTGAAVAVLVEEVRSMIDDAASVLAARHVGELEALDAREEQFGTRGSGRKRLEEQQRREMRKFRTDELRFGLATLARRYGDAVASGASGQGPFDALARIGAAAEALVRNPNEALLLQALFARLPPLAG